MKLSRYVWLPVVLLLLLIFSGCEGQGKEAGEIKARNGILDLSRWDFSTDGNIKLDGEWAFYWDKLIAPGNFGSAGEPTGYYNVPQYWTAYANLNLPSKGYATYRLMVKTNGKAHDLSIKIPEIYTEYSLWINGELITANGNFIGESADYLSPDTYDFRVDGTGIEIVLQIKNSAHVYAGIGRSFKLGTTHFINAERNNSTAVDLILFAVCLAAGIHHLILYIFRKKDRELIYFCALCIAVCIRSLLSNETLLMQAIPNLPFWLGSKIVTLTIPMCIVSMMFYTRTLYRKDMPGVFFNVLLAINALYALLVLTASSYVYSLAFIYYLCTVAAACALGAFVSVRATVKKRPESIYFLIGMFFLLGAAVTDILSFLRFINLEYLLSVGLTAFIIMQAILLAKRYAGAFRNVEMLSKSLKASLDKVINTETAFLNAQVKPHFLYNTLNIIAEYCETDSQKAGKLIVSLSKYLRGTLDFENLGGIIPLKKELELVHAYVSIEKARFEDINVEFDIADPLPDIQLPPLTIQPLVENAIKHGLRKRENGGVVKVKATIIDNSVLFCVEDDGIGIPEKKLNDLLDTPRGSASIGLYNINTRLFRLYGKGLSIRSTVNVGTSLSFDIPIGEGLLCSGSSE